MTDLHYTLLGYGVGLSLLLGYAAIMCWKHVSLGRGQHPGGHGRR